MIHDVSPNRKVTISDLVEKALGKKGKGEEIGFGAILSSVVCTTLGSGDETDIMFKEIESLLITCLLDNSIAPGIRSKCATALGINSFITSSETIDIVMDGLYSIFKGSFLKGDGSVPTLTPQVTGLHSAALNAWTLLMTVQSLDSVLVACEKSHKKIVELLESPDVDLRMTAGETIAVLYEILRDWDESYEMDNHQDMVEKLQRLATDGQRFRAKKDRRIQRSTFRDVLRAVEEHEAPNMTVKFGTERLFIDSWCRKKQYESFCLILGSGMNHHLAENDLLRDIFELGPPVSGADGVISGNGKVSKFERHMGNLAASKARTKIRGKLRDKRADVLL